MSMTTLYLIKIQRPGREIEAVMAKPAPAMRLVRRLISCGIPHAYSQMEHPLVTSEQIEDMIDELEHERKVPA